MLRKTISEKKRQLKAQLAEEQAENEGQKQLNQLNSGLLIIV